MAELILHGPGKPFYRTNLHGSRDTRKGPKEERYTEQERLLASVILETVRGMKDRQQPEEGPSEGLVGDGQGIGGTQKSSGEHLPLSAF